MLYSNSFSVEYKPLNIAVNIQSVLTGNYSCHNMSIPNMLCELWYKSKTTWLMDKNTISHSVDMTKECHSAYGLVTSLCHIHLIGYCVFLHQPCGLAIISKDAFGESYSKLTRMLVLMRCRKLPNQGAIRQHCV